MRKWTSLSWQIQLYYLLVLIGLAVAVDILMIRSYEATRRRELEVELASSLAECKNVMFPRLAPQYAVKVNGKVPLLGLPPHGPRPSPSFKALEVSILEALVEEGWFGVSYSPFGNMHIKTGELPKEYDLSKFTKKGGLDFQRCGDFLVVCQKFNVPGVKTKSVFGMGMPLGKEPVLLAQYRNKVILISFFSVVGVFISGALFVTWVLRPLDRVCKVADAVAMGDFNERVKVGSLASYEFKHLGESLNKSFAGLEGLFEKQKAFASEVAHELRTPVTGIVNQAKYATGSGSLQDKNEALDFCYHAGRRMHNITDSLLELASVEVEAMSCRFESCMLHVIAMDAASVLCEDAEAKGITVDLDQLEVAEIYGNPDLLWQLVVNLLKNAIKYTAKGAVKVRTLQVEKKVVLEVSDTGAGISEDDQQRIFDRFYRGDSANKQKDDGVGIGLTICKSILNIHHGRMELESELGEGSVFRVIFDVADR